MKISTSKVVFPVISSTKFGLAAMEAGRRPASTSAGLPPPFTASSHG
jgi:hypothetical protein